MNWQSSKAGSQKARAMSIWPSAFGCTLAVRDTTMNELKELTMRTQFWRPFTMYSKEHGIRPWGGLGHPTTPIRTAPRSSAASAGILTSGPPIQWRPSFWPTAFLLLSFLSGILLASLLLALLNPSCFAGILTVWGKWATTFI